MTRTVAPKDFAGRLWRNLFQDNVSFLLLREDGGIVLGADNTVVAVWPCNLAPDHLRQLLSDLQNIPFERAYPNLGALDLTLRTVDESYPLSEVESGIL